MGFQHRGGAQKPQIKVIYELESAKKLVVVLQEEGFFIFFTLTPSQSGPTATAWS